MINDVVKDVSFFGIFVTGIFYFIGILIQKKLKIALFNPLLVSCILIIIFLLVTKIDYNVYLLGKLKPDGSHDGTGAAFFQNMLTPTTVCLAIPLYEKLEYLKKYPVAIFGGIVSGCVSCMSCVALLSYLFNLSQKEYLTLIPKSITTAIGMSVSEEMGGIVSVTVAAIIITGIFGNVVAGYVMKVFRIKNPVAVGLACGTSAHAMGTSKAAEFGEVQEAMSGLSIAVAGIITVIIAPLFAKIIM